jgi:hypothetical protein
LIGDASDSGSYGKIEFGKRIHFATIRNGLRKIGNEGFENELLVAKIHDLFLRHRLRIKIGMKCPEVYAFDLECL